MRTGAPTLRRRCDWQESKAKRRWTPMHANARRWQPRFAPIRRTMGVDPRRTSAHAEAAGSLDGCGAGLVEVLWDSGGLIPLSPIALQRPVPNSRYLLYQP